MNNKPFWMVRSGRDSVYVDNFLSEKVVAIGWPDLGELPPDIDKAKLTEIYQRAHPTDSAGSVTNGVSQIVRFRDELNVGDGIVTYDRDKRLYYVGVIAGAESWQPQKIANLPRARAVEWTQQVPRDALSKPTRNTLGAIQTLFSINADAVADISSHVQKHGADGDENAAPIVPSTVAHQTEAIEETEEVENAPAADVLAIAVETAEQAIEERIVRLDWEKMQELVAGVLRAMGYRTSVSPRGADQGVDIFASPDGLGLQEPRIFKNRAFSSKSSTGPIPAWVQPKSVPFWAGAARATNAFTFRPAASPAKRATKRSAPTCRFNCSD